MRCQGISQQRNALMFQTLHTAEKTPRSWVSVNLKKQLQQLVLQKQYIINGHRWPSFYRNTFGLGKSSLVSHPNPKSLKNRQEVRRRVEERCTTTEPTYTETVLITGNSHQLLRWIKQFKVTDCSYMVELCHFITDWLSLHLFVCQMRLPTANYKAR